MQTERAQVVLRQRPGLEALDLGFAMARHWWRPLALTWIGLVLPLATAVVVALRDQPFVAVMVLWWLRPVFGRIPLHVLGRALFGERVGLGETLRALPGLARSGLLTSLTLQRLSPARTFLQPVLQLEGLRGPARRARCSALARRDIGSAMGLLSAGAHFNGALILGGLLILNLLVPSEFSFDVFDFMPSLFGDADEGGVQVLLPIAYLAGTSVVEPLLVAGGFALYLNRRVDLEGWDIDLVFRNLTRRVEATTTTRRLGRAAALAALALVAAAPIPARSEAPCAADDPTSAAACIEAVLEGGDFGSMKEVNWWLPKETESDLPTLPSLGWLPGLIASALEILLWTGLALLVFALLVALARRVERRERPPPPTPPRATLFGLELDPASLPDDLVASARAFWARGEPTLAMSLLYRGALVHLTRRVGLEIPDSATELECVALVDDSSASAASPLFTDLTRAWVGARYAATPPPAAHFESICERFEPLFGDAS